MKIISFYIKKFVREIYELVVWLILNGCQVKIF